MVLHRGGHRAARKPTAPKPTPSLDDSSDSIRRSCDSSVAESDGESRSPSDGCDAAHLHAVASGITGRKFERIERELRDRELLQQKKATLTVIERPWFECAVAAFVALNALTMGLEADYPDEVQLWTVTENIFTLVFLAEMITKFHVMKCRYFHDWWNCLDMVLVLCSVIDTWILTLLVIQFDMQQLSIVRLFRLVRLVRVVKLMHKFRRLVLVLYGVIEAVQTLFWVGSVLFIIVYMAAVFCVGFFSKETKELYPGYTVAEAEIDDTDLMSEFNPDLCFGNMRRAMFTLFNLAIQAEWGEIVRPIMVKQPFMVLFLTFYVLVVSLGIMNVIIGMVADNVIENADALKRSHQQDQNVQQLDALRQIHIIVSNLDVDKDGFIEVVELDVELTRRHSKVLELLERVDLHLPRGFSAEELICLLDTDGDGNLEVDSFVEGFYRVIDSGNFQQICMLQSGINSIKRMVKDEQKSNCERLESIDLALQRLLSKEAPPSDSASSTRACADILPALAASLPVTTAPATAMFEPLFKSEPESYKTTLSELEASMRRSEYLLGQLAATLTGAQVSQPASYSPEDQSGRTLLLSPALSSFDGTSWTSAETKAVGDKPMPLGACAATTMFEEKVDGEPLLQASTKCRPHVIVSLPHTGRPREESQQHSPQHQHRQMKL